MALFVCLSYIQAFDPALLSLLGAISPTHLAEQKKATKCLKHRF